MEAWCSSRQYVVGVDAGERSGQTVEVSYDLGYHHFTIRFVRYHPCSGGWS